MNLPETQAARHSEEEALALLADPNIWPLLWLIEGLEEELEALPPPLAPIRGGPPPEWDAWIHALPDKEFLECLGPKNSDDPHRLRLAQPPKHFPTKAKASHLAGSWEAFR